jgi:uncharacterized membrane protein YbaN (DUF454 family)
MNGILKKAAGWILIAVGIAGLILPLIPGIVLILVGLSLIESRWAKKMWYNFRRILHSLKRRLYTFGKKDKLIR